MNCDTFRKVNGAFTRKTICFTRKQKYYYILMYCFTRKTLVGVNRARIHILGVKQIYYYILMYCFTRKVNCFTRKNKCFTRKTLDK